MSAVPKAASFSPEKLIPAFTGLYDKAFADGY